MPSQAQRPLPAPAADFVPHRPPMLQIETLEAFSEEEAIVSTQVAADNLLLDKRGQLAEVGLIEMMAQAYAARQGYADLAAGGLIRQGYLVGLRSMRLAAPARVGDRLQIYIRTLMAMDGFALAEGEVSREGETLATGTLKLWIVPEEDRRER